MNEKIGPIGFWKKLLIVVLTIIATYFLMAAVDARNHDYSTIDVVVNTIVGGFTGYAGLLILQGIETEWTLSSEALLLQACTLALTAIAMSISTVIVFDWGQHYEMELYWMIPISIGCTAFTGVLMMLFTDFLDEMFPVVTEKEQDNG